MYFQGVKEILQQENCDFASGQRNNRDSYFLSRLIVLQEKEVRSFYKVAPDQ